MAFSIDTASAGKPSAFLQHLALGAHQQQKSKPFKSRLTLLGACTCPRGSCPSSCEGHGKQRLRWQLHLLAVRVSPCRPNAFAHRSAARAPAPSSACPASGQLAQLGCLVRAVSELCSSSARGDRSPPARSRTVRRSSFRCASRPSLDVAGFSRHDRVAHSCAHCRSTGSAPDAGVGLFKRHACLGSFITLTNAGRCACRRSAGSSLTPRLPRNTSWTATTYR